MARLSPADAAAKWAQRTQAATTDYTKGVQQVNVSPGQAAARQANVASMNYQKVMSDGTWAQKMNNLSLADWQNATVNKGGQRYGAGAAAALPKMQQFMSNFLPQLDTVTNQTRQMPKGTLQQNIARAVSQMEGVAKLKGKV